MSILGTLSRIFLKSDDVEEIDNTDEQVSKINSADELSSEEKEFLIKSLKDIESQEKSREKSEFEKSIKVLNKPKKVKAIEENDINEEIEIAENDNEKDENIIE